MKQQEVLKKIGGIISELSEQYQYLQSETEHLNSLELELFIANAHFLTDHAEVLRKISNAAPVAKALPPVQETPPSEFTTSSAVKQPEDQHIVASRQEEAIPVLPEGPPDAPADAAIPELGPAKADPVTEESPVVSEGHISKEEDTPAPPAEIIPPAAAAEPVPSIDLGGQTDTYNYVRQVPEPVTESTFSISSGRTEEEPAAPVAGISALGSAQAEEPAKPTVTSAAPPEAPLTLNQRFSAQNKGGQAVNTASGTAPQPAIRDLKSAVSLNDKLLYVRDLFNGYNLSYSEALELLNRCKSFDEADRLLKANYVTKNNWPAHEATADKFYALLHRRFGQE